jgi:4-amino-4-deoxy-L-arabinose transferase-like glycosyltransferase
MNGWSQKKWVPWAGVGLAALLVQVVLVWETARQTAFMFPLVDSSTYHQLAQSFLRGTVPRTPFWQPPLYPWFLAGVYGLLGVSMTAARAAHGLLGVAGALLTLALGIRLGGRGVGIAAGVAAAVCGPLLFFQTQLLPVGLAVVLDVAVVLQVLRALDRPSWGRWLLAGGGLGLAGLAVPNALVMGAVALPLAWRTGSSGGSGKRAWSGAVALLAGLAMVVGPVALRNRVVGKQGVLISTNSGINFYIGNNPHMDVTVGTRPGLDWERLTQIPYQRGGVKDARSADWYFWREGFRFMIERPGSFLGGLAVKSRQFLAAREIPRNLDIYTMRQHSVVLKSLVWKWEWFAFPFGVVGPLGLLGLALACGRGREHRVTVAFVALYALSVVLFFPTARYRAPLWPFFLIYAAFASVWLVKRVRVPGAGWWMGVAGLGVSVLLVNIPVAAPSDGVRFDAELENAMGAACQIRGRQEAAMAHYTRARELDPRLSEAAYNMGVLLSELKRRSEAKQAYRDVLRIRPDHDKARINLGIALFQEGALGESADLLELATVLNPGNPRAWHNLAIVLEAMGRRSEALTCWEKAAARDPSYEPVLRQMRAKAPLVSPRAE